MITFTFNGIDFSSYIRVNEITGRGVTPSEVPLIKVPGMTGAYAGRKRRLERVITVKFTVVGTSLTDLRNRINTLSERLDLDEAAPLVFSDEPDKTFDAILAGASDDDEIKTYGFGTLTFLCPDPYKYGPEMTADLNLDTGSIVNVAGTAETKPVFTLTVKEPITYAAVFNEHGEYMMIGEPNDIDTTKVAKETRILYDPATSMTGWTTANAADVDDTISGTMEVYNYTSRTGSKFQAASFGSGSQWHGPAIKKSLPETLQDFRLDVLCNNYNTASASVLGKVEVFLLDVNGVQVAKMSVYDNMGSTKVNKIDMRVGPRGGYKTIFPQWVGRKSGDLNHFWGMLRIQRVGKKWTAYAAEIDEPGGMKHGMNRTHTWTDHAGQYSERVASIVIRMASYGANPAAQVGLTSLSMYRVNPAAAGVPIIADTGDEIEFDHRGKGSIRINGEDAKSLKNFGAEPFALRPQSNTIVIEPAGSFTDAEVKFRNAYK